MSSPISLTDNDDPTTAAPAPAPKSLPPFRTFILRNEKGSRVLSAHGYDLDGGVIAFWVYFFLPNGAMAQTARWVFFADAGWEIEEVNASFSEPAAH